MRPTLATLNANLKRQFPLDSSFYIFGILLIELATLNLELSRSHSEYFLRIICVRLSLTLFLIFAGYSMIKYANKFDINSLTYPKMVLASFSMLGTGGLFFRKIGSLYEVPLQPSYIHFFAIVNLSIFWLPLIVIAGGRKTSLLKSLFQYEQRLLVSTRKKIRESEDYKNIQLKTDRNIRQELNFYSNKLLEEIDSIDTYRLKIEESNDFLQKKLIGDNLRKLSVELDNIGKPIGKKNKLGQNLSALRLLFG